jgi:hypothetical protein
MVFLTLDALMIDHPFHVMAVWRPFRINEITGAILRRLHGIRWASLLIG